MNIQNLLNEFTGVARASQAQNNAPQASPGGLGGQLSGLTNGLPGGLVGGAAAGGIMALLVGNKSARKFAGRAATYGGAAVLGGMAYSAYKNWKVNSQASALAHRTNYGGTDAFQSSSHINPSSEFQLTLVKAMIAAAKADGHIDADEQKRIFDAVDRMALDEQTKGVVFDLLRQPIYIEELAHRVTNIEQKSEVYLASCLAINPDHHSEHEHLNKLALVLALPPGLAEQIKLEVHRAEENEAA